MTLLIMSLEQKDNVKAHCKAQYLGIIYIDVKVQ